MPFGFSFLQNQDLFLALRSPVMIKNLKFETMKLNSTLLIGISGGEYMVKIAIFPVIGCFDQEACCEVVPQ